MITAGRRPEKTQARLGATHERGQLIEDDLHDHLARRETPHHVLTDGPLANARNELLDRPEVDVRLEKRHAHLAHGGVDVGLDRTPRPVSLEKTACRRSVRLSNTDPPGSERVYTLRMELVTRQSHRRPGGRMTQQPPR